MGKLMEIPNQVTKLNLASRADLPPFRKVGSGPKAVTTSLNTMHPCFGPSSAASRLGDGFLGGDSALLIALKLISVSGAVLLMLLLLLLLLQGCQIANFDPFLSLESARVEGVGAQSKERKGSNFAAQPSGAIFQKPEGLNTYSIWQP